MLDTRFCSLQKPDYIQINLIRLTSVCHNLSVPSSDPEAYSSPSGENRTQCTGPKCPLKLSEYTRMTDIRHES